MTADVSDIARLDAQMRSIYGCTLNEFMTKCYQAGYEQGLKNGRRLEKGKSEWAKLRGRPPLLKDEILVLQFIDFVDAQMNQEGISFPAAVSRYFNVFGRAWKELNSSSPMLELTPEKLLSLYKRKTKPKAISDNARRAYKLLQSDSTDLPDT